MSFLYEGGESSFDDHCYHEFFGVLPTADAPNDGSRRSIKEFLADVSREAALGWQAFDPYDSKGSFGAYLTSTYRRKSRAPSATNMRSPISLARVPRRAG